MAVEDFIHGYIEAAFWTSIGEESGSPLDDDYGPDDLDKKTRRKMEKDCKSFYKAYVVQWADETDDNGDVVSTAASDERAGHDFWLTRNGHGAGFWDGDYKKTAGKVLTAASRAYGGFDLYVGDDGKVYGTD